ncbi:MAG: exopolysaccharide biosynthesis polyprenyl glycosylphosphotransferase [Polyangiaceae bacterium]
MADLDRSEPLEDLAGPDSLPHSQAPVTIGFTRVSSHRLSEVRRSSAPPPASEEILRLVADLLLAAACVDGEPCRRERHALRKIEARLAGGNVPAWLNGHISAFDPQSFDFDRTTQQLRCLSVEQRRYVAELVREICEANNVFDLEEERFLLSVIFALALDPVENEDLVVPTVLDAGGMAKRGFDIAFASLAIAVLLPLFAIIAVAVKLSSPGTVFFAQRRYGKDGKVIKVLKFRTMRALEDGAVVTQAKRADPRVTAIGAFLRRTSLDELPQFFNVLLGDMSVVGPRPHAVAHNEQHRTLILEYMLRHKVKPGITGWAQVNGFRGETDTLDKMIARVQCDLDYIRRYSFWLDLKIIWLTVFGRKVRSNAY